MFLGVLAGAKLYLVSLTVDIDPIHDGRLVSDAADQARIALVGVWEIVTRERVAKGDVIFCASIDVELMSVSLWDLRNICLSKGSGWRTGTWFMAGFTDSTSSVNNGNFKLTLSPDRTTLRFSRWELSLDPLQQ